MLTETEAVSHHDCVFGKWYYSDGQKNYGTLPVLRQIENPHAELHKIIREIIKAKESGNESDARALFSRVDPLSREIVGLINQLESEINKA